MQIKTICDIIKGRRQYRTKSGKFEQKPLCTEKLLQFKAPLEKILVENIIPYWYPYILDLDDGGYRLNHDHQGKWQGLASKTLVAQARTVWFFSRLAVCEFGNDDHLKAARHGYEFLIDKMRDKECGGFYWEVDSGGRHPIRPDKHLYGQAFALCALSQFAAAARDASAAKCADELFHLLEEKAHDSDFGGYLEYFQRDWHVMPEDKKSYLGSSSVHKLMNTHLHLMEAISAYHLMAGHSLSRQRLIELIFILSSGVRRATVCACTDIHLRDWTPIDHPRSNCISYGHILENIWLLMASCDSASISPAPLLHFFTDSFAYALQYGEDGKKGGFYHAGPFDAAARSRGKIWWVQAEALVAAIRMYVLTHEERYLNCFSQTLNWINNFQVDWHNGDWHAQINRNGKPSGDKAGEWKTPYHNGRAMIECLKLLHDLSQTEA